MKTCKYGCGKMKSGGKVATVKKYAAGGSTIVGMPQYPNNPRTYGGRMLKEGGSTTSRAVKPGCTGGMVKDENGKCVNERAKIKFQSGGPLKPVNKTQNPGLAKLPTAVRNKMGYAKKGGAKKR